METRGYLEAVGVGDVVHNHGGIGAAVEPVAQRIEPLLAGGVPDLELDQYPLL